VKGRQRILFRIARGIDPPPIKNIVRGMLSAQIEEPIIEEFYVLSKTYTTYEALLELLRQRKLSSSTVLALLGEEALWEEGERIPCLI